MKNIWEAYLEVRRRLRIHETQGKQVDVKKSVQQDPSQMSTGPWLLYSMNQDTEANDMRTLENYLLNTC